MNPAAGWVWDAVVADALARAVTLSVDHVAAGGLPFVGVLIDQSGRESAPGFNRVAQTGDPTAHAEIVAMRRLLAERGEHALCQQWLLATGEPCRLCYRFAADHGVAAVRFAVSSSTAADWGFDYRVRGSTVDQLPLIKDARLVDVPRALEPFRLHRAHRGLR